jgi:hyperosmotically inducible protein
MSAGATRVTRSREIALARGRPAAGSGAWTMVVGRTRTRDRVWRGFAKRAGALARDVLLRGSEDTFMRKLLFATLLAVAALSSCKSRSHEPPAADNTARNERERAAPTADNASNGAADRDVMQKIRKAVMDDGSLSTNAHNCKIVAQDGTITLVGPVASEAERAKVEQIATANAGDRKVVNQLEVTK